MIHVHGPRLLVQLPPAEPQESVTDSGIILMRDPDLAKIPTRGIVVQVGRKSGAVDLDDVMAVLDELQTATRASEVRTAMRRLGPASFDVSIGDCVLFPLSAGEEVRYEGVDYVILNESEVLGVVDPLPKDPA